MFICPKTLNHVAIIMDGNGRWAKQRGHSRYWGHIRGARVAKNIIEHSSKIGLKTLTLFAFSTENWQRPIEEVSFLMRLLIKQLKKEIKTLKKNNVRFTCIGDLQKLPKEAIEVIQNVTESTKDNTGLNLVFALSYSGKYDLLQAIKKISKSVLTEQLSIENINEELVDAFLQTATIDDPDLIIRTSGEKRISNFMLWQSAYSEWAFTQKLWPEFTTNDFENTIDDYACRSRRYGKTPQQAEINL